MIIKTDTFEIYRYDPSDKDQRHLRYVLDNDKDFREFVTKKITERLLQTPDIKEGLQFNSSYLVKYKQEFVGYIRLESLDFNGNLKIQCAVSKEFRNQSLGSKILEEISNYIFEHYEEVEKLKGVIERSNYASKKMASNVGFVEESRDNFHITVSKSRS